MSPFIQATLKTLITVVGGTVGPLVLSAIDHPSGGFASALASNPIYAEAYGLGVLFVHNVYDHVFGAPQAPATSSSSSTTSAK